MICAKIKFRDNKNVAYLDEIFHFRKNRKRHFHFNPSRENHTIYGGDIHHNKLHLKMNYSKFSLLPYCTRLFTPPPPLPPPTYCTALTKLGGR
jgi:hypothetical protein